MASSRQATRSRARLRGRAAAARSPRARSASSPGTRLGVGDPLAQLRAAGLWREEAELRLHLGCGEQYFRGYVNIDYPPTEHPVMRVNADLYTDVTQLDFPPHSVDEVRLHHLFEHFDRTTALAMLIKWHRWLKTGGTLRIETPDLVGSATTLLSDAPWETKMAVVRHLAGDQVAAWGYHLDHWFAERFRRTLTSLGFGQIRVRHTAWSNPPHLSNVEVVATKIADVPLPEQTRRAEALLRESMVARSEEPSHSAWRKQLRQALVGEPRIRSAGGRLPIVAGTSRASEPRPTASARPLEAIGRSARR